MIILADLLNYYLLLWKEKKKEGKKKRKKEKKRKANCIFFRKISINQAQVKLILMPYPIITDLYIINYNEIGIPS